MISVVIPTYNGEKYIKQSIDSILWQTYENWELIIVDDCSIDNTSDIVDEYAKKDNRIKVIHNISNKKLPSSLNIGFEKAVGEYFSWSSDDNAYARDAFEKMRNSLINNKKDFVFANYKIIDPEDYIIGDIQTGPIDELPLGDNIGACFLYKKEIHEELGGYNIEKFLVEDYDFWLRAYWKNYKFIHVNESLYFYRIHKNSLTSEKADIIEKYTIKLIEENIKYIKDGSLKIRVEEKINKYYKWFNDYIKDFKKV